MRRQALITSLILIVVTVLFGSELVLASRADTTETSDDPFQDGVQFPADYLDTPELLEWYYGWGEENDVGVWVNDDLGWDVAEKWSTGDLLDHETKTVSARPPKAWLWWDMLRNDWNCWINEFGRHKHTGEDWTWEYKKPDDLLQLFVYNVSRGGIWVIQMVNTKEAWDLMSEIGDWLAVNGEAIYGTRPVVEPNENVKKVPERWRKPGTTGSVWAWQHNEAVKYARQQGPVYYTEKGDAQYAIHWGSPGDICRLENLDIEPGSEITMLGYTGSLDWHRENGDVIVELPDERPSDYAFALKIQPDP